MSLQRIDEDTLERYVYLRNDGVLVVESMLDKLMPYDARKRLMSCVEDNIIDRGGVESIYCAGALKDFYGEE